MTDIDTLIARELRRSGCSALCDFVNWEAVVARARELLVTPEDRAVIAAADKCVTGQFSCQSRSELVNAIIARRAKLAPKPRYEQYEFTVIDRLKNEQITIAETVRRLNASEKP